MIFGLYQKLVLLLLVICFALDSEAKADSFYVQAFDSINHNISEGVYEENLHFIEKLTEDPQFQSLSCYEKGKIFHRVGVSAYMIDQEETAIRFFRDSVLSIWQQCPAVPPTEKANTIYNLGVSYQYLNEFEEAKRHLVDALWIFENDPDYPPLELAKKYQGTANFYLEQHNSFRAELYYESALNIYEQLTDTERRRFGVLNHLLVMSIDFKQYEKSKAYFEKALSLYTNNPKIISELELSFIYQNAGIAHLELGEYQEALEKCDLSLSLVDAQAEPIFYSNAIELKAIIKGAQKDYEAASVYMNEVLAIRQAQKSEVDDLLMATTYENISDVHIDKKELSIAEAYLKDAFKAILLLGAFDEDQNPIVEKSVALDKLHFIRLIELKVKIYKKRFEEKCEIAYLKKALDLHFKIDTIINQHLIYLQFEDSKLEFLELMLDYYGQAITNAIQLHTLTREQKYLEIAYLFSSKTKAVILQYEQNSARAFQAFASEELIEEEKKLRQNVFNLQIQVLNTANNNDADLKSYIQAQRELDEFIKTMEQVNPDYYKKSMLL